MRLDLRILIFSLCGIFISCSGCFPYFSKRSINLEPSSAEVQGISECIKSLPSGGRLNVVMVHGMRSHEPNAYDELVGDISDRLKLNFITSLVFKSERDAQSSHIKIYEYAAQDNRVVRFTFVHWSPLTSLYKDEIKRTDEQSRRALVNRSVKHMVVNDGFGDVTAILRKETQEKLFNLINKAFITQFISIDQLQRRDNKNTIPLFINKVESNKTILLSASLGSKITLEYIRTLNFYKERRDMQKLVWPSEIDLYSPDGSTHWNIKEKSLTNKKKNSVIDCILHSDYNWYMFSNQLVLLRGFNFDLGIEVNIDDNQAIPENFKVYSFYDFNDFLGYKLHEDLIEGESNIVEISIPIARWHFLDVIANPNKAHSGSKSDKYVLNAICNGIKK